MLTYEWDPAKSEANYRKHGVRFSDALSVFGDDGAVTIVDSNTDEERYVIIGFDASARLLVVAFTWRGTGVVRLISARKATRTEAEIYAEEQA
jgi:uncharacterized DUF497 family protein